MSFIVRMQGRTTGGPDGGRPGRRVEAHSEEDVHAMVQPAAEGAGLGDRRAGHGLW